MFGIKRKGESSCKSNKQKEDRSHLLQASICLFFGFGSTVVDCDWYLVLTIGISASSHT